MRLTASRTSEAALSTLVPGRNSIQIRVLFSSLEELISCTPVTRATAPSKSRVTSASIVSGDAPGSCARTVTNGRSTSGNSRTSIAMRAAIPAMAMSKFNTRVRSGRLTPSSGSPPPKPPPNRSPIIGSVRVRPEFCCSSRSGLISAHRVEVFQCCASSYCLNALGDDAGTQRDISFY